MRWASRLRRRGGAAPEYRHGWADVLTVVGDGTILTLLATGTIGALDAVLAHLLLVAALAPSAVKPPRARALARIVMALVLGPLAGPAIALAGIARPVLGRGWGEAPGPDIALPERSAAERVLGDIRAGRRPQAVARRACRYADLFVTGKAHSGWREALGALSRHYSPEMLPALRTALNSPDPEVRVQAAAVFARLRTVYGEKAKTLLAVPPEERRDAAYVADCRNAADSGLVDADIADALRRTADENCPIYALRLAGAPSRAAGHRPVAPPAGGSAAPRLIGAE